MFFQEISFVLPFVSGCYYVFCSPIEHRRPVSHHLPPIYRMTFTNCCQTFATGLVEVTNDSPALIGTPITFSVLLSERVTPPLFYRIYFKDDLNIVDTYLDARGSITKQFVYDSKIDPNHAHVMNVTVEMWIVFFPMWIVGGSVLSSFKLTGNFFRIQSKL